MDRAMRRIRGIPENGIEAARELRRRHTPAEQVLWGHLRGRRLNGLKFRRQYPVGSFITDFCCPAKRLIVEVDGEVHEQQHDQDRARTEHLESYGYTVIRFTNLDVANRIDFVLSEITRVASELASDA